MSDLLLRPALELASLVRARQVSARELTEAALARLEATEPQINAFAHVDAEGALATADAIHGGDDRPFAGVPIAIKDNKAVKGMPLTLGATFMPDVVMPSDAHLVRRLRAAGFVIIGKTTLPEWGIVNVTEARRFGPTRNPWDLDHTPGGSSGGSAAAVAAGVVPLAHGNDGGGSIRIPAACCGLVGLKPARGRISQGPEIGDSYLTSDGVLTRTVADQAALLDVLAGYEPGDATWAPPPLEPFAAQAAKDPGRLRIGVTADPPLRGAVVDPVHLRAMDDAAALLTGLGHTVEPVEPSWHEEHVLAMFTALYAPLISMQGLAASRLAKREPTREDMEAVSWMLWERSRAMTGLEHQASITLIQRFARRLVEELSPYDAVLTPTLAERPLPIGELDTDGPDPEEAFRRSGRFTPHTALANVLGIAAISLPLAHGDDGLPLAVQLLGRPAGEGPLLALAAQIEAAKPWADRIAPL